MNDQQPADAWPPRPTLPPAPSQMPPPPFGNPPPPPPPGMPSGMPSATPWPVGAGSTAIPQHAPVYPSQTNLGLGLLFGLVAAIVGGAIWYGIVVASDRQFIYLAIGYGVLIGAAVVKGAKRANPATAVVAAVIAAIGIVMSYYFITRHLIIDQLDAQGVPLFGSFEQVKTIVKLGYEEQASQYLYSIVSVVVAGFVGFKNR